MDSLHAALHTRDTTNNCCFNLPGKKTSYPCLHAVQSAVEKVLLFPVVFNLDCLHASFRRDAFVKQIFLRSANWMCSFPQPWPACQRNFLCLRCPARLAHNAALLGGLKVLVSCTKVSPQHSLLSRRTGCITPQHSFERVSNYALKVGGKKA